MILAISSGKEILALASSSFCPELLILKSMARLLELWGKVKLLGNWLFFSGPLELPLSLLPPLIANF